MKRKTKAMVVGLGICIVVLAAMSAVVIAEKSSDNQGNLLADPDSTAYVGIICFTYDDYGDTWVLRVDRVRDALQVTGHDIVYPGSSMDGGGVIKDGHWYLNIVETYDPAGTGRRCIHAVDIDMTVWPRAGFDSFSWHNPDGTGHTTHMGIGLHQCPCPAPGKLIEGETTDYIE